MSQILAQFAAEIAKRAAHACAGLFEKPVTVLVEPPSHEASYPAISVLIDKYTIVGSLDDEIAVDEDGLPLVGGNNDVNATPVQFELDPGVQLVHVGTIRAKGKIWVGARYAVKREEMEMLIIPLFYAEPDMPGVLRAELKAPKIGPYTLPWALEVAAFAGDDIGDVSWNAEMVFSERLSSELPIQLEVPMMIPRNTPIASNIILMFTNDMKAPPVEAPSDLDNLQNLEQYEIAEDGTVSEYTP